MYIQTEEKLTSENRIYKKKESARFSYSLLLHVSNNYTFYKGNTTTFLHLCLKKAFLYLSITGCSVIVLV